jgi:tryptophanyl-tRNA synthetase
VLLAAGLDPDRCLFFRQGDVPEHTELCWLLSSVTSWGDLNRMTQFKEKSAQHRERVSAGLFIYPLLQAADVLVYRADEVPVGDDQRQHVELMREIARSFNARFGEVLVVPEHRIPEVGARIMDLQFPENRMSTTASSEQGAVYILDEPDAIRRKFKRAVADSGRDIVRRGDKPGISNLIDILAAVRESSHGEIEREFADSGYGAFKEAVAEAVVEFLAPVRERYGLLRADEDALEDVFEAGAEKARALASGTVADVREAMGVGPARRLIRRGGA